MSSQTNALSVGASVTGGTVVYRVERVLGAGGFGITYLVSAPVKYGNVVGRMNFALKEHFVSNDCEREPGTSRVVCSKPARERVENAMKDFVSEARRLHKVGIEHPNIVRVNEVFEANNTAYYVMEYLDGESLRSYVKRHGALSEDEMMQIMRPVIDAVGYLHRNRMTHLDVKPDNIMLATDDDGNVRPVLIDFGLSKHYGADGRPTSTINTLGCSDGYAPMEQYMGITTFSPTADIYALGATMLFCLTGHDPGKASELRPGDLDGILSGLALTESTRDAIARAMATSQYDRTQSVDTLFNEHIVDSPSADLLLPVGAGRGLPADIGTPTARLNQGQRAGDFCGQRAGHGAAPTEPDKPTQSVTAASTTSRRPLFIGAVVAALLILAGVLLFTRGCSSHDTTDIRVDSQQPVGAGHGLPADFDLACVRDGKYYYFTESEWNSVTDKSAYTTKGVVLSDFIVALQDLTSEELTWDEAMSRYGSQLPDKGQGEIMGENRDALNRAIKAFGGKKMDWWYWTKTEYDSSCAWAVLMNYGDVAGGHKTYTFRVRAVVPVPVAVDNSTHSTTVSLPEPEQPVVNQQSAENKLGHAEPADFDLACMCDGKYRYFTAKEWNSIADKSAYTKKGVVLSDFIVALQDLTSEELTWDEAMSRYGSQLFNKDQGEIMAENRFALNQAIKAFGGKEMDFVYWTKTEYDSSNAWYIGMNYGTVLDGTKPNTYRVRAVAPVPVSSAM